MSPIKRASTLSLLVLLITAAVVYAAIKEPSLNPASVAEDAHGHAAADHPHDATAAQAVWVCPMHPEVMQDHPGRCPICGMDLVQAPAQHSSSHANEPAPGHDHTHVSVDTSEHEHEHEHGAPVSDQEAWVCPMHPEVVQDHPGRCPICGMDLVETQRRQQSDAGIQVDTGTLQRMGVRTAPVSERELAPSVRAYGTVGVDEGRVLNVTPKTEGWVRRLYVSAVGQSVVPGTPLYELYSPELLARQREYVALLQRRDQVVATITNYKSQSSQVAASLARERLRAREKLTIADIDNDTLRNIERSYRPHESIVVRARKAGFVTAINAREGSYVDPAAVLLTIADPRKVKIDVVLYPNQLQSVRPGDAVEVTTTRGEHVYTGRLASVSPVVDEASRTARAVIRVDNTDGRLHPGAYVDVTIATQARKALAVPRSALMWTGDGTMVMRALGNGRFAPAHVHTGIENSEWVEITDGLEVGTQVAVNGQFLLDAAASLQAVAQRMQGGH